MWPPAAASFSIPASLSVNDGISGLFSAPSSSSSSSSSTVGDPALGFAGSWVPVHADGSRAEGCLYMITETETRSMPSPTSTMANLFHLNNVYRNPRK